ncbi:MAG: hypothetical protein SP1CHLAM54_04780 [Chlamydiia bacterium]|nr:hypothetical protein [Chlamydiia bacterium]MCH9615390.1 hypothetical protein [Chlamydiia bacterium]
MYYFRLIKEVYSVFIVDRIIDAKVAVSQLFVPNTGDELHEVDRRAKEAFISRYPGRTNLVKIPVDGMTTTLDGMEIRPNGARRWIVFCLGRGGVYERHGDDLYALAVAAKANLLAFNYRGVGDSTGVVLGARDLVTDALRAHDFIQRTHHTTDITFHGFSLGTGVVAEAALQRPQSKVVLDSGYRRLTDAAVGHRGYHLMRIAMHLFGWQLSPEEALPKLGKRALVVNKLHDSTIPFDVSLYAAVESSGVKHHLVDSNDHGAFLTGDALSAYAAHVASRVV